MKPKESIDFNYLAVRPYENLNDKDVAASMERLKQAAKNKTKLQEGVRQAVIAGTTFFGPYMLISQMIH